MSMPSLTTTDLVVVCLKYLIEDKATILRRRANVDQEVSLNTWPKLLELRLNILNVYIFVTGQEVVVNFYFSPRSYLRSVQGF